MLTGHDLAQWDQALGTTTTGRLGLTMLGPVITAYEHAMTGGEKRAELRPVQHSAGQQRWRRASGGQLIGRECWTRLKLHVLAVRRHAA